MREPAVELALLRGSTSAEQELLRGFLGHKGEPWLQHVEDYFGRQANGRLDGLDWRFHVALVRDQIVANVCVWDGGGVGLLGHVFTKSEFRGRGIARALMRAAEKEFFGRGGLALYLNTEPESFQERFYQSLGYKPVPDCPGSLMLGTAPVPEPDARVRIRAVRWGDWPALNAFAVSPAVKEQAWVSAGVSFPASVEYHFLNFTFGSPDSVCRFAVLDAGPGRIAGFACLSGQTGKPQAPLILDMCPGASGCNRVERELVAEVLRGYENEEVVRFLPPKGQPPGPVEQGVIDRDFQCLQGAGRCFIKQ